LPTRNKTDDSKTLILGITGCIAAYKSPDIARGFMKLGYKVVPVLTKAATQFITPLTMQSICGGKAITSLFDLKNDNQFSHLSLSSQASAVLIAPATANILSKLANGTADDALSTLVLASKAPLFIAPAMNEKMYQNRKTQKNIDSLKKENAVFIGPQIGSLACGEEGVGRLAKVSLIVNSVEEALSDKYDFAGKKILVTAGGTREAIDPVRFIGNRSSGKMGYACAIELKNRGARVKLISANCSLSNPEGVEVINVETSKQMLEQVKANFSWAQAVIMSAAVSDFSPKKVLKEKIKKGKDLSVNLQKTPDILGELAKVKGNKILIGFAAESQDLISNAAKKLKDKKLDLIFANDITKKDSGFSSAYSELTCISPVGTEAIGRKLKEEAAAIVADKLKELFDSKILF